MNGSFRKCKRRIRYNFRIGHGSQRFLWQDWKDSGSLVEEWKHVTLCNWSFIHQRHRYMHSNLSADLTYRIRKLKKWFKSLNSGNWYWRYWIYHRDKVSEYFCYVQKEIIRNRKLICSKSPYKLSWHSLAHTIFSNDIFDAKMPLEVFPYGCLPLSDTYYSVWLFLEGILSISKTLIFFSQQPFHCILKYLQDWTMWIILSMQQSKQNWKLHFEIERRWILWFHQIVITLQNFRVSICSRTVKDR